MSTGALCRWWLLGVASSLSLLCAGEPIAPGATREAVLAAYGRPSGQSKLGAKEILNFPQGQVMLDQGRVVRVNFRNVAGKTAASDGAPGNPALVPAAKFDPAKKDGWMLDYEDATREATRRGVPILTWFAGSDWSPTGRQFEEEVAVRPEFATALGAGYVFLRIDLPAHNADSVSAQTANYKLRERLGVTVFPALLVLSTTGEKLGRIELSRPRNGESYLARVIARVRETHDLLGLAPLPSVPRERAVASVVTSHPPPAAVTPVHVVDRLLSAGWGVISAVGSGLLVTGLMTWLLWRNGSRAEPARPRPVTIAHRISEAACGLPAYAEIVTWSKERIVVVAAGLGESEGYAAEFQRTGSDKEIVLKKLGEPGAQAYVCCASGDAGVIPLRRVRELVGMLTADGVAKGWYVAPLGFTADARAYAEKHGLNLIDGHRLVALLHELPPVAVPSVTRQPWAHS